MSINKEVNKMRKYIPPIKVDGVRRLSSRVYLVDIDSSVEQEEEFLQKVDTLDCEIRSAVFVPNSGTRYILK